MDMGWW